MNIKTKSQGYSSSDDQNRKFPIVKIFVLSILFYDNCRIVLPKEQSVIAEGIINMVML